MKTPERSQLWSVGIAFTIVGIIGEILSWTVLAPDEGTNTLAIGAACFIVVGPVALVVSLVRRRSTGGAEHRP